jgi:hypothetical protein
VPLARVVPVCVLAAVVIGLALTGHLTGHHVGFGLPVPVIVLIMIIRRRLSGRR